MSRQQSKMIRALLARCRACGERFRSDHLEAGVCRRCRFAGVSDEAGPSAPVR